MKVRPKLVLCFSMIFVISFAASSYVAHTTIETSLLNSGLSDQQVASILEEIGTSIGIAAAVIGTVSVLLVFWVSSRIALPIRQIDSQLKSQRIGQKLRNIEIKRSSIDTDDEIKEVVNTINSMINQINELEDKKEELLAIITHELKTPLASILGHSQVLQKPKMIGELNPKQTKAINIINKNVSHLKQMITEILDYQKLDLEKMRFVYTFTDISKLIEKIEASNKKLFQEKKIDFRILIQGKIFAKTDRDKVEQVLTHLILNAVDFSPKRGKIEVGAYSKDDEFVIYVKDNGIGIASEKQTELFKKDSNPHRTITRVHGGTGLGLVICKGIVNALGGKIWVESESGKGATFFFTLPKTKKLVEVHRGSNNE